MAARVTVKVRFVGASEDEPWTNLRVSEAELALPSLRGLLAKALQCSPGTLAYLQYQDADGDWLTVCNDADILDGVDELGGSQLRLQVLWRGARDAFQPERGTSTPALADRSADAPLLANRPRHTELASLIQRGDIEALADSGQLAGALSLSERAIDAHIPLRATAINRLLRACADRDALPEAIAAFKVLKKSDLDPDKHAFDAMITVGTKCGDLSLAVKAMRACLKARLPLDVATIKRLRLACASEAFEVKQAVWKAAHRQLSLQSARQLAQGQMGISQTDLDAIVSPASPRHNAPGGQSTTADTSADGANAKSEQRARYSELVAKIVSGTATEAEQNEAELIAQEIGDDSNADSPNAPAATPAPGPPRAPAMAAPTSGSTEAARKAELEALPGFKLKAAAQAAGVKPLPIGQPARTKEETISLILELEGLGGPKSGQSAAPAAPAAPPAPGASPAPGAPPTPRAPPTPPAPPAPAAPPAPPGPAAPPAPAAPPPAAPPATSSAPFSWPAAAPDNAQIHSSGDPKATVVPQQQNDGRRATPDPLLVGAARPSQQQELVTPGSRVVVSDSLSKHFSKKGVVVKSKGPKCKVVFDGKDDAVHVIARSALFSLEAILQPLAQPLPPTTSARQPEVSPAVAEQALATAVAMAPAAAPTSSAAGQNAGKTTHAAASKSTATAAGAGPYGGPSADGKWVNSKPPPDMDMFAEMAWRKKQRAAKEAWEAGGNAPAPAPTTGNSTTPRAPPPPAPPPRAPPPPAPPPPAPPPPAPPPPGGKTQPPRAPPAPPAPGAKKRWTPPPPKASNDGGGRDALLAAINARRVD